MPWLTGDPDTGLKTGTFEHLGRSYEIEPGADLTRANLAGADLTRANLRRANLEEANLEEANIEGANPIDFYNLDYWDP